MTPQSRTLLGGFRASLGIFAAGLSGAACLWPVKGTAWMLHSPMVASTGLLGTGLGPWLARVNGGLAQAPRLVDILHLLGCAQLVLLAAVLWPMLRPVRNRWLVDFGLLGCAGVLLVPLVDGELRGVSLSWRLVECCLGLIFAAPLLVCATTSIF